MFMSELEILFLDALDAYEKNATQINAALVVHYYERLAIEQENQAELSRIVLSN